MYALQNTNPQNPTKIKRHLLEEDKEDALSLCDLPLTTEKTDSSATKTPTEHHREPSTELFEFITSTSNDVSPAENIIFGGKIIPLNQRNVLFSPPEYICPRIRARSESLSAIQGDKINFSGSYNVPRRRDSTGPMRTSRSLDYRKLSRDQTNVYSPPPESLSPAKNTVKVEPVSSGKNVRPRWYVIMFGMVKFPPVIELKDIKSRQIRRNVPPAFFQSPANQRSRSPSSPSRSWRFLNALSCKEPTSVAATAPFWVPHP